ncbi:winged helix-turn-helix domain-containing protein [Caloranaerobacter azorensis]|nr:winged helix-turn-helix domain-containing protein [Caloranaerobacter azorensis]
MDFKKYILDKKYLILFYIILMLFISLVVYLDITVKVSIGNILYINFVSFMKVESEVIEYNNVFLNIKDSCVLYEGKQVELTKNEFKIMYILMKNAGSIVSRDKIMRSLWEDESFVDDNTLTVNINRLRKKLEEIGIKDFIKTKKGQGYIIL